MFSRLKVSARETFTQALQKFLMFLFITIIRACMPLTLASHKPPFSQERRPADSARGTVEVEEEEVGDAINNNSQYNPVPDRCLWIEA